MIETGKGAHRGVPDFEVTRYGCCLIAMNGDVRKQEIAFAQSCFAPKTRESEPIGKRMPELQKEARRLNCRLWTPGGGMVGSSVLSRLSP